MWFVALTPPLLALLLAPAAPAQEPDRNPALHVAFVGALDTDRGRDFAAFLRRHFGRVDLVERDGCTPGQLRTADVVVLDWPQKDGIAHWFADRQKPRRNPLGNFARWDRPTVLLGSAGLNVAADWNLPGNYG